MIRFAVLLIPAVLCADTWNCISLNNSHPILTPNPLNFVSGGTATQQAVFSPSAYSQQLGATVWQTSVTATGTGAWPSGSIGTYSPAFTPMVQAGGTAQGYASAQTWFVQVTSYTIAKQQGATDGVSVSVTSEGYQYNIPASCLCYPTDCQNPNAAKQCTATCSTCPPRSNASDVPEFTCAPGQCCPGSPILQKGSAWSVSSVFGGIAFQPVPGGPTMQASWPEARSHDRWLVDLRGETHFPVRANLVTVMFGNLSTGAQTAFTCPGDNWKAPGGANGYRALFARFDRNRDCKLEAGELDGLYWWDDGAHGERDGLIQADEIEPVTEPISLRYREMAPAISDANGNTYRYCSSSAICDVFLLFRDIPN